MFRYNTRGEDVEATEAIRDYVGKKIGKLGHYLSDAPDATAHVNLEVYTGKTAKVEVTIPLPYLVLRAEKASPDLYASIDSVVDKLERQIRKLKAEISHKSRETDMNTTDTTALFSEEDENENGSELGIVRMKRLSLKPMDSEKAVLQMDMLGHNFFISEDVGTNGTNIIYRRKDGKYGLTETD